MNSSRQLKALIHNLSKEKGINAQILLRNYMLERLLERISVSKYKSDFILNATFGVDGLVFAQPVADISALVLALIFNFSTTKKVFSNNEYLEKEAFKRKTLASKTA